MTIDAESRIVASDERLQRLAEVLAVEIALATGLSLGVIQGDARAGDIVLKIDPTYEDERYTLSVDSIATVEAGEYGSVALGTATLLQSLTEGGGEARLPRVTMTDGPRSSYRGLMVDVARQWHSIETLKQIVVLCRLYKINYLHLHLTDNQSFTFPSATYAELATPGRHYMIDELRDLERFATERGVTIVPELDVPGHSWAMVEANPELFGLAGRESNPYIINMGSERVYAALDTIVGEIAGVFESSPYIHIGGDEAWMVYVAEDPTAAAFMARRGIPDVDELYRYFIARMNEIVKRHGKRTIVWEGFRKDGAIEIPRDITVMAWETAYQLPQELLEDRYSIINVSWKPLYVVGDRRWSPEDIYGWNMFRWENWYRPTPSFTPIQQEPSDRVIGAQMAAWEQSDAMEIPSLRRRLPAMSERIWQPDAGRDYADFARSLDSTDRLLQKLIRPATVRLRGQSAPGYMGPIFGREHGFERKLRVTIEPFRRGDIVRYTTDGSVPTDSSPVYSDPIDLGESTALWLRVYGEDGIPKGFPWRTDYEYRPVDVTITGVLTHLPSPDPAHVPSTFSDSVTLDMRSTRRDGAIRYTLDGSEPGRASPVYEEPVVLYETTEVRAAFFDGDNVRRGEDWRRRLRNVDYRENLTRGKPVTASQGLPHTAEVVVDGLVDRESHWGADSREAAWLQIDLEEIHQLSAVGVYTYWDGERYYRYTVELSADGESWARVADGRRNTDPAAAKGYRHEFAETEARYVRVTLLENSANPGLHLVEVRVF
jgi:hexosaminidase